MAIYLTDQCEPCIVPLRVYGRITAVEGSCECLNVGDCYTFERLPGTHIWRSLESTGCGEDCGGSEYLQFQCEESKNPPCPDNVPSYWPRTGDPLQDENGLSIPCHMSYHPPRGVYGCTCAAPPKDPFRVPFTAMTRYEMRISLDPLNCGELVSLPCLEGEPEIPATLIAELTGFDGAPETFELVHHEGVWSGAGGTPMDCETSYSVQMFCTEGDGLYVGPVAGYAGPPGQNGVVPVSLDPFRVVLAGESSALCGTPWTLTIRVPPPPEPMMAMAMAGRGQAEDDDRPPPPIDFLKVGRCVHLGQPTGERLACKPCGGRVFFKAHSCSVYGKCVPARESKVEGVRKCNGCPHWKPETPIPEPPPKKKKDTSPPPPFTVRPPCVHLGEATEKVVDGLKVFGCALFEECTVAGGARGVKSCEGCGKYERPKRDARAKKDETKRK